ncbi:MAG: TRAP transporter small permease subunit [Limimaricola soesokkakensis]|uniref:TRAP transporter small permease subunit n=1 Tax=Limimaricola soesokkakensis TaxID=1343159 RepID=UPI004058039F
MDMTRLLLRLRAVLETLIALLLAAMVALTFADVISRRLFGAPIYGAHDITEHLMALVVFAGLPIVTLGRAHLTIDLLDKLLLRPGLAWWRALVALATAAVLGFVA